MRENDAPINLVLAIESSRGRKREKAAAERLDM